MSIQLSIADPKTQNNLNQTNVELMETCRVVEKCFSLTKVMLNQYFYQLEQDIKTNILHKPLQNISLSEIEEHIKQYLKKTNPWEHLISPRIKHKLEHYFNYLININISSEEITDCLSDDDFTLLKQYYQKSCRTNFLTSGLAEMSIMAWDMSLPGLPSAHKFNFLLDNSGLTNCIPSLLELDAKSQAD